MEKAHLGHDSNVKDPVKSSKESTTPEKVCVLLKKIRKQLTNNDKEKVKEALELWQSLRKNSLSEYVLEQGPSSQLLVHAYSDNNNTKYSRTELEEILRTCIQVVIVTNKFHPSFLFKTNSEKVLGDFIKAAEAISKKCVAKFLVASIIPDIFTNKNEYRGISIDLAYKLSSVASLGQISRSEIDDLKVKLKTEYLKNAEEFCPRQPSSDGTKSSVVDPKWHKICSFVPYFLGVYMHDDIELINVYLSLLEASFRSKNSDYIASTYDCWRELIDNYKLNWEYLSGNRQIRLLIKPLKIKLSRSEKVLGKRFDLWVHLLQSLKTKAHLCLEEFLKFCYNPFYVPGVVQEDSGNINPTKNFSMLWPKMTDILICFMGHYGHNSDDCNSAEDTSIISTAILINEELFLNFHATLVPSVIECCLLLQKWCPQQRRKEIVTCLWNSVFALTAKMEDKNVVTSVLKDVGIQSVYILNKVNENYEYMDHFFVHVVELYLTKRNAFETEKLYTTILDTLILPIVLEIVTSGISLVDAHKTSIANLVKVPDTITKIEIFTKLFEAFLKKDNSFYSSFVCDELSILIWSQIASLTKRILEKSISNEIEQNKLQEMLLFPLEYKATKRINYHVWTSIAQNVFEKHPIVSKNTIKEISKNLNSCSYNVTVLSKITSSFHKYIASLSSTSDEEYTKQVKDILNIILSSAKLPSVGVSDVNKQEILSNSFENCFNSIKTKASLFVSETSQCFELFITENKNYNLLKPLKVFLSDTGASERSQYITSKLSSHLSSLLCESLSNTVKSDVKSLLALLEIEPSNESPMDKNKMSRAAKITNMVVKNNFSPSTSKKSPNVSPFTKKFASPSTFGTPSSRMSKIKSALEANSSPKYSKKDKPFNINEDSSQNYVLIDTKVVFDTSKLTEAQKEATCRRRDDIPALYNDLSQSQSNMSCGSSSQMGTSDSSLKISPKENAIKNKLETKKSDRWNKMVNNMKEANKSLEDAKVEKEESPVKIIESSSEKIQTSPIVQETTSKSTDEPCIDEFITSLKKRKNVISNIRSGIERNEINLPDDVGKVMTEHYMSLGEENQSIDMEESPVVEPIQESDIKFDVPKNSESIADTDYTICDTSADMSALEQEINTPAKELKPDSEVMKDVDQKKKKKKSIANEMKKLQMDIVGGDEIIKKIQDGRSARLRTRKSLSQETTETNKTAKTELKKKQRDSSKDSVTEDKGASSQKVNENVSKDKRKSVSKEPKSKKSDKEVQKESKQVDEVLIEQPRVTKKKKHEKSTKKKNDDESSIGKENIIEENSQESDIGTANVAADVENTTKKNIAMPVNEEKTEITKDTYTDGSIKSDIAQNTDVEKQKRGRRKSQDFVAKASTIKSNLDRVSNAKKQENYAIEETQEASLKMQGTSNVEEAKQCDIIEPSQLNISASSTEASPKRGRGRPKKIKTEIPVAPSTTPTSPSPRKRGRPRKNSIIAVAEQAKVQISADQDVVTLDTALKADECLSTTGVMKHGIKSRFSDLMSTRNTENTSTKERETPRKNSVVEPEIVIEADTSVDQEAYMLEAVLKADTLPSPNKMKHGIKRRFSDLMSTSNTENTSPDMFSDEATQPIKKMKQDTDALNRSMEKVQRQLFSDDAPQDSTDVNDVSAMNDEIEHSTSDFKDSEDIIESSQESTIETAPLRRLSNVKRVSIDSKPKLENTMDNTEAAMNSLDDATQVTMDNASCSKVEEDIADETLTCNIGSESMKSSSNIDTMSINEADISVDSLDFRTKVAEVSSPSQPAVILPTSPVTTETPNRNSELMSSTCNISPIKNNPSLSAFTPVTLFANDSEEEEEKEETKVETDKLQMDDAMKESEEIINDDDEKIDKNINEKKVNEDESEEKSTPASTNCMPESNWKPNIQESDFDSEKPEEKKVININNRQMSSRSARVMNLIPNVPVINEVKKTAVSKIVKLVAPSPSPSLTGRIRKMMMMTTEGKDTKEQSQSGNAEEEVLTFKRDIPKSTDTPRSGILKRKTPDTIDEGISPAAKHKRVNFCDPPTSCKKIFFSDPDEHTPVKSSRRARLLDSASEASSSAEKKVDMEESVIKFNAMFTELDSDVLYSPLASCTRKLWPFMRQFGSAAYEQMKADGILFIGQLATLKKSELCKYSIQEPKEFLVQKALKSYKTKLDANEAQQEEDSPRTQTDAKTRQLKFLLSTQAGLPNEEFVQLLKESLSESVLKMLKETI